MHDDRFPVEVVSGVPVVAAPEEIDITDAPALRSALLQAASHGHGPLRSATRADLTDEPADRDACGRGAPPLPPWD